MTAHTTHTTPPPEPADPTPEQAHCADLLAELATYIDYVQYYAPDLGAGTAALLVAQQQVCALTYCHSALTALDARLRALEGGRDDH